MFAIVSVPSRAEEVKAALLSATWEVVKVIPERRGEP